MKGKKLISHAISFFCLSLCICFEVFYARGWFLRASSLTSTK
jgi:hypothetical protein